MMQCARQATRQRIMSELPTIKVIDDAMVKNFFVYLCVFDCNKAV